MSLRYLRSKTISDQLAIKGWRYELKPGGLNRILLINIRTSEIWKGEIWL